MWWAMGTRPPPSPTTALPPAPNPLRPAKSALFAPGAHAGFALCSRLYGAHAALYIIHAIPSVCLSVIKPYTIGLGRAGLVTSVALAGCRPQPARLVWRSGGRAARWAAVRRPAHQHRHQRACSGEELGYCCSRGYAVSAPSLCILSPSTGACCVGRPPAGKIWG